ncbi:MAG: Rnase Y domain-containing protein, partial [Anaerolineae bacterium]
MPILPLVWVLIGLAAGGSITAIAMWFYLKPKTEETYANLQKEIEEKRAATEQEAAAILKSSQQEASKIRLEAEKVTERRYQDLARAEERIDSRTEKLDQQAKRLEHREQSLNKRQSRLDRQQNELDKMAQEHRIKLEEIAALSSDEAKQLLLQEVEKEARQDMARQMREIEDKAKETAEAKAREYIAMAIQRVASDHVADITVSTVALPKEEMKGRIIGRNGRNIRAFEQAAGVD